MNTYADMNKKPVIKRGTEAIVIKNCKIETSLNSGNNPASFLIVRDNLYDEWIIQEINLFEDFKENYYYLFESIEILNDIKYRIAPSTIRILLSNCEDYAMGKEEDFRIF